MIQVAPLLRGGVQRLSHVPWAFDALRWILEGGYRRHRQLLARQFAQRPRRVLDCGCGTGTYSKCFAPQGYIGIDICPAYVARARNRHPSHRFQTMDATNLTFADNSFEAVVVCGLVHHLDQETTRRVLSEIARVLQPDGRLLLWEDVPTRDPLNWVGHWVHQLDVGAHIRPAREYAQLLAPYFRIESTESLRSGFMDYIAFNARKHAHAGAPQQTPLPASYGNAVDLSLAPDGILSV